jgi:hypothetical protein
MELQESVEGIERKYNPDFQIFSLPNKDFISCPLDGSRRKNGECSEKDICPRYSHKCPEYRIK